MEYYLKYCLGLDSHANIAAEKGNVVHKAMELLAHKKLLIQNCDSSNVVDDEMKFDMEQESCTYQVVIDAAYNYYKSISIFTWADKDYEDCIKWFYQGINFCNRSFNPMNQTIVSPEAKFDIEIKKPWAAYSYPNGMSGWLSIKGTIDLIIKDNEGTYEMVDYKTGRRLDWATGKEKDYEKLRKDPQLLIYYYAARHLYPDIKKWTVTIYFIKDGGPFTLSFGDEEYELAEKLLKKRFYEIRNSFKPKKIFPSWKCSKLCWFGKYNEKNEKVTDYKYSTCAKMSQELLTLGMERCTIKNAKDKTFSNYGAGGGKQN